MKIYTRTVVDMATGELEAADAIEHAGPVAECKGGGSQTTTTKTELDPRIAAFYFGDGTAQNPGLIADARAIYQKHQAQPFNNVQQAVGAGMDQYFNSGTAFQPLNANSQLASRLMARGGVQTQPVNYGMPNVNFSQLMQPPTANAVAPAAAGQGAAAAPGNGILSPDDINALIDARLKQQAQQQADQSRGR